MDIKSKAISQKVQSCLWVLLVELQIFRWEFTQDRSSSKFRSDVILAFDLDCSLDSVLLRISLEVVLYKLDRSGLFSGSRLHWDRHRGVMRLTKYLTSASM